MMWSASFKYGPLEQSYYQDRQRHSAIPVAQNTTALGKPLVTLGSSQGGTINLSVSRRFAPRPGVFGRQRSDRGES